MNSPEPTKRNPENQSTELESFLDCLFAEMAEGEEIPFWASARPTMGFPKDEPGFLKALRRSRVPKACYFGTSTMRRDESGILYNRQSQFAGFYVLVLDDIGTGPGSKIPPSELPPSLAGLVTYRIETSPGNEQWGFALDRPIRDLELAKAFLREVTQRAGTDSGGCMPNKLVRLPCGVNLKEKYQAPGGPLFECRILELNPDRWITPAGVFLAVDAGVSWEDLEKDHSIGSSSRKMGTTAHRKTPVYQASLAGIVDPVLEWLNETNQIVNERGEWVDIICPWAAEHSAGGGNTAGYAPLGVGSEPDRRGFHCFHDSCSGNKTAEFLTEVLAAGGPRAAPKSPVESLVTQYAFDQKSNRVIDMKSESMEWCPDTGFKNQHSTGVFIPDATGKIRSVSEYRLFMDDPNRMRLAGCVHVPGGPRMLASESGGYPSLNLWRLPDWGSGSFDPAVFQVFVDFIHYLIPNEIDAEWFLDHIAAKAQDPRYRGPTVVLSTPVEGTGRGTLETMLGLLWGAHNIIAPAFGEYLKAIGAGDNNSWLVRDWIIIAEAKDLDPRAAFKAYETGKKFMDPAGTRILIKEKYLVSQQTVCFGSTIICSQHGDVFPVDSGGTRIRRIENTLDPWSDSKFQELYAWIEGGFESDVWRALRSRDLSGFNFRARQKPPSLADETLGHIERKRGIAAALGLAHLFAEQELSGMVFVDDFIVALGLISEPLGLDSVAYGWEKPFRTEIMNKTRSVLQANGKPWRPRFDGCDNQARLRATTGPNGRQLLDEILSPRGSKGELAKRLRGLKRKEIVNRFVKFCRGVIQDNDSS